MIEQIRKHNLNTKKQQWKTVIHHHPVWIQKCHVFKTSHSAKKTSASPATLLCFFSIFWRPGPAWANSSAPKPPLEVGSSIPCVQSGDPHLDRWEKHQLHRRIPHLGRRIFSPKGRGEKPLHREPHERRNMYISLQKWEKLYLTIRFSPTNPMLAILKKESPHQRSTVHEGILAMAPTVSILVTPWVAQITSISMKVSSEVGEEKHGAEMWDPMTCMLTHPVNFWHAKRVQKSAEQPQDVACAHACSMTAPIFPEDKQRWGSTQLSSEVNCKLQGTRNPGDAALTTSHHSNFLPKYLHGCLKAVLLFDAFTAFTIGFDIGASVWWYGACCGFFSISQLGGKWSGWRFGGKSCYTWRLAQEETSPAKIDVTSKSPGEDISVVRLTRTDTTPDHSQKAEKVWE